jgi:hypothetical protein
MEPMEVVQVLGNLGEFVAAIAVVLTLFYLAVQVRHSRESVDANTRALDDSRKLALVQTFQSRAELRINMLLHEADSELVTPVMDKLAEAGWPEDSQALESLSTLEQRRVRSWITAEQRQLDNYHYQFEQGLVDQEHWETVIVRAIRINAPRWKAIQNIGYRPRFKIAVERILADDNGQSH